MLGEPNVQRDQRIGEIDEATHQRSDEEMTADLGIVQGQRLEPIDPIRQTELNLHGLENDVVVALGQTITNAALEGKAGIPPTSPGCSTVCIRMSNTPRHSCTGIRRAPIGITSGRNQRFQLGERGYSFLPFGAPERGRCLPFPRPLPLRCFATPFTLMKQSRNMGSARLTSLDR